MSKAIVWARLVVQLDAVIVSLKVRAFIFIVFLKMKSVNRIQGRIQDFPKGGVETRDTKWGGGGGGGGGAVRRFRPDTKSGEGFGLLSRRGGSTFNERGGCKPPPPPLYPPLG